MLEALRQDPGSKMYMFGLAALERFKSRLKDCAQYCQHIVSIPHFSQFPPVLAEVRTLRSVMKIVNDIIIIVDPKIFNT